MKEYELIIFDLDDTLTAMGSDELMPGVQAWFSRNRCKYLFALASNQGGVGLRHWMESGGFGDPGKYPTELDIWTHINGVVNTLFPDGEDCWSINLYVCFAYQSKKSLAWAPTPYEKAGTDEWQLAWRKPAPGMLLRAMQDFQVQPDKTLMVGNGSEDHEAAERAGCAFMWADDFFKREDHAQ